MTAASFYDLSLSSKSFVLWSDGAFLSTRVDGLYKVCLYTVYDFLVEVYFSSSEDMVEKIVILDRKYDFEDYLDEIDLIDLYLG